MSIMSDTWLYKKNSQYEVRLIGGFTFVDDFKTIARARKKSVFEICKSTDGCPNPIAIVDEVEALAIADADNCIDDGSAGYHKFAGDSVFLIDFDEQKVFYRTRNKRENRKEGESYLADCEWEEIKV